MAFAEDIEQTQQETVEASKERVVIPATVATVTPLTVIQDGSGVAVPCLNFACVPVKEGRRVGVVKLGTDLVIFGAFGSNALMSMTLDDDLYVGDDLTIVGDIFWGASTSVSAEMSGPVSQLNATFTYVGLWVAFVAPPSGKVSIRWGGSIKGAVLNSFCYIGYELRTGAVNGSGSVVSGHSAAIARSIKLRAANTFQEMAAGRTKGAFGLTPNADYHVRIMHASSDTGGTNESSDMDVAVYPEL